ncbi:MAG: tetratricopeptide repeat protein, partial [Bacteroidales bacterium]|nr:tetratricopeptide repeat protein [Bacteroidales bacterium]
MKKTVLTLALIISSMTLFAQSEEENTIKWINTYSEYNNAQNWDAMIQNFDQCIKEIPSWDFAYYYKGMAEYHKKDYANAVKDLNTFTSKIDSVSAAYLFLAQSYNGLKQTDKALETLALYTQKEPEDKNGYIEMANSYIQMKDYDN